MFKVFAFLFVTLIACSAFKLDGDVLVLTDSDVADAIKENQFILVEWYAPWCGHCKKLEPEYTKAASELKKRGIPVALAKVDATENAESAQQYGVRGYPTMKWFINGEASEYGGGRTSAEIVSWVVKKTGPAFKVLSSAEEVEQFKSSQSVVVVGYFAGGDSESAQKVFETVAQSNDDVSFAVVNDASVASAVESSASSPAVVLYKDFDEKKNVFSGDYNKEDLEKFVQSNSIPLVPTFSQETAPKIFGSGVESHFLYFNTASDETHEASLKAITEVAAEFRGKTLFVFVPSTEERVMSFFDFKKSDLPKGILVALGEGDMKKFGFDQALTADNIRAHVSAFHSGSLKPTLKSEEVPADNSGPVKVIVGTTFNEIVLDTTKDVLVEFYAPWCGHCKSLTPTYEKLGAAFADNPSIVIAKVDATANDIDHPAVHVQGFPTILFFAADNKDAPVTYEGERDLESLKAFVSENSKAQPAESGKDKIDL